MISAGDQTTGTGASENDDARSIREQIRIALLRGEYAPRQRLIEADLCERFGASRFQIRTALQDLAAQGLVEFQRNRGARVRDISIAEAIEITEVRLLLEGFTAARAAANITADQAVELRRVADGMRTAVEAGELMTYSDLNVALHATLRQIAAHGISGQMLQELRDLTARHHFTLSLVPGRSLVSLPQHEAIVAAVAAGDAEAAEAAMRAHLQSVIDALTELSEASLPAATGMPSR